VKRSLHMKLLIRTVQSSPFSSLLGTFLSAYSWQVLCRIKQRVICLACRLHLTYLSRVDFIVGQYDWINRYLVSTVFWSMSSALILRQRQMDGRTDGRTDGQTRAQHKRSFCICREHLKIKRRKSVLFTKHYKLFGWSDQRRWDVPGVREVGREIFSKF
jgi:hypothetical protein